MLDRLPEEPVTLTNLTVPACAVGRTGDLIRMDLTIADGHVSNRAGEPLDMRGAMAFPAFVDMHTHLDKGHIWPRKCNPDGRFRGALAAVAEDRKARWSAEDVRRRMEFGLRCAYVHGTAAIRTHLDSMPPQDSISWPVFQELRSEWAGRIRLQGVSLDSCDRFEVESFRRTAELVADAGGVLGLVTFPVPDLADRLRDFLTMAEDLGLAVDFHVDESMDPDSETLRTIAEAVLETSFRGPVVVGHCCSLSVQDEARAMDTLDLVAKAGLDVVSLPMCNLYLQDRGRGTPRRRGITLVHEMRARGIRVSFASDNTRDPFYAYGDLDMVEVMREATRIGHLDHSGEDWANAFLTNPARSCGFDLPSLAPGAPADLVIFRARNWSEFFARPQSDRVVIRAGRVIDRALPDYAELDDLMEGS